MSASAKYQQELSRSLSGLQNIYVTLSSVTPASSVFIIVPAIVATAGTGSFLAMLFAAIIGIAMAFCWAELAAAFPIAGGDYCLVYHAFSGRLRSLAGPMSFIQFVLFAFNGILIVAVIALGMAQYLDVVWQVDPKIIGALVVLISALVGVFGVRFGALVTGIFLAIELLALVIMVVLGLIHFHPRFAELFSHWVVGQSSGGLRTVSFGELLSATAISIFAYNGYNNPVYLSEETRGSSKHLAAAVIISLLITVLAEILPTLAVLLGAPNLDAITASAAPMGDFIRQTSNEAVYTTVSLGIAIAIFNAVIAIILVTARVLYASGRDNAWGPASAWLASVHPRFKSPWVASLFIGAVSIVLCFLVPLETLIRLTGASLVVFYALIALAGLVGRLTKATTNSPYKMPLWPLPPIIALAALGFVAYEQPFLLLGITGLQILIALIYWAVVLRPKGDRVWQVQAPIFDDETLVQ